MNGAMADRGSVIHVADKARGGVIGGSEALAPGRYVNAEVARTTLEAAGVNVEDINGVFEGADKRVALTDMSGERNERMGNQRVTVYDTQGNKVAGGGKFYGAESVADRLENGDYLDVTYLKERVAALLAPASEALPQTPQAPEAAKRPSRWKRVIGAVAIVGLALSWGNTGAQETPHAEAAPIVQHFDEEPVAEIGTPMTIETPAEQPMPDAETTAETSQWQTLPGEGITQVLEREGYDYTLVFDKIGPNGETIEDILGQEFGGFYGEADAPAGTDGAETRIQSSGAWDHELQQRTMELLNQAAAARQAQLHQS